MVSMPNYKYENFSKSNESFQSAVSLFNEKRNDKYFTAFRNSLIQTFEFTFETAWKCIAEIMEMQKVNLDVKFPRAVIKKAYQIGLLHDEQLWVDVLNARNEMSHIYKEERADEIAKDVASRYAKAFADLVKKLGEYM
jgi:nucleotidyltransferase substrate binding protein (TIGR01987 family)